MLPPEPTAEKKLKVKYRRKPVSGVYQSGEVAAWPADEARRLVAAGDAVPVGWRLGNTLPEPEPAA